MNLKKITAAVLTLIMGTVALSGCSTQYDSVLTIDGQSIAPNAYLYAQYQAYNAAFGKVESEEEVKDIFKETIEDMPAKEWIANETIKALQKRVWVARTFEEMGLELTESELASADNQAQMYWQFFETQYTKNGIGLSTYTSFIVDSLKAQKIFEATYGEEGEKAPTDEEYAEYLEEKYARVKGFYIAKLNDDAEELTAEQLAQVAALALEAVEELNSGADFEATQVKYMTKVGEIVESENDFTKAEEYTEEMFVSAESTQFDKAFIANVFAAEKGGKFDYEEMDEHFFVYQRVNNYADADELDELKSSILPEMKSDEFNDYMESQFSALPIEKNEKAVKYYALSKIK